MSHDTDRVTVNHDTCSGCGRCLQSCPTDVFRLIEGGERPLAVAAYPGDCCDCFLCVIDCPENAITVKIAPVKHGFVSIYHRMGVEIPSLPGQEA